VDASLDEPIEVDNLGALSVWTQLTTEPDFAKAFRALSQLKNLLGSTKLYDRYFSYNLYRMTYGNLDEARKNVLFAVSKETSEAIFNDATFGWKSKSTLYKWVRAMYETDMFNKILDHF